MIESDWGFRYQGVYCPDVPSIAARLWAWVHVESEDFDRRHCRVVRDGVGIPTIGHERDACSNFAAGLVRAIRVYARSRAIEVGDGKRYVDDVVRRMGEKKALAYLRTIALDPVAENRNITPKRAVAEERARIAPRRRRWDW